MTERMWPQSEDTQDLLASARGGDADVLNQLFERHRAAVARFVRMRIDPALAQRVDASDVVQEVLIDANRRIEDYLKNQPMPFHLWLRHIAKDRLIDAHRRHRLAARRSVDRERPLVTPALPDQSALDLAGILADRNPTPAAQATAAELQRRFHDLLDEMEESDREVVLMRHAEQLTNREIAQALGLTEPAASMRYLRAMRRLKERMSQDEDRDASQ